MSINAIVASTTKKDEEKTAIPKCWKITAEKHNKKPLSQSF